MNNQTIVIGLIALVIGAVGGYVLNADNGGMSDHTMSEGSSMNEQMDAMTASLSGKTGDEFDKAFLSEMIMHHQGAVQMAEVALQNAKHQEIKDMANAIISAQTTEIKQMQDWQTAWYGAQQGNAVHHAQ